MLPEKELMIPVRKDWNVLFIELKAILQRVKQNMKSIDKYNNQVLSLQQYMEDVSDAAFIEEMKGVIKKVEQALDACAS